MLIDEHISEDQDQIGLLLDVIPPRIRLPLESAINPMGLLEIVKNEKSVVKEMLTSCFLYSIRMPYYKGRENIALNDKGAKSKIIKKYIPIMNTLINQYLQSMDFFVSFHLDEEFKETVKSRHRDTFDYINFSEGEKMRIDLALLFTWRAIAKMKNSTNTNLLVLDEIFDSSLDGQGTDDFFKILKDLTKENIFIISHKGDILFDRFTNIIKFEKEHNFTKIGQV